jgi:preprotein translocase subunit SecE
MPEVCSSIGRAPVSKTGCWGFESLQTCQRESRSHQSIMIGKIFSYFSDVKVEMSKVTWPTRKDLIESTRLVLLMGLVLSIMVFFTDRILSLLLEVLL